LGSGGNLIQNRVNKGGTSCWVKILQNQEKGKVCEQARSPRPGQRVGRHEGGRKRGVFVITNVLGGMWKKEREKGGRRLDRNA